VRILVAHRKKPPFETRIFEKIGACLAMIPDTEVTCVGNKISASAGTLFNKATNKIRQIALFNQSPAYSDFFQFFNLLRKETPDVLIICSSDLTIPAILYSLLFNCTLIWDVQENQALNFKYQKTYSSFESIVLPSIVSTLSKLIARFPRKIWFAEHIYLKQLKDWPGQKQVWENKVAPFRKIPATNSEGDFVLFSGVITKEAGIFEAIHFFSHLQMADKNLKMVIAGFCPDPWLRLELAKSQSKIHGLVLKGIDTWLTGDEIAGFSFHCLAVLAPYKESPANFGKIPTKIWEARYFGVPVLVPNDSHFLLLREDGFNISGIQFNNADIGPLNILLTDLKQKASTRKPDNSALWDADAFIQQFRKEFDE
jgi:hypothetical protein